ncbi:MAG TPA: 2-oxoacid:acceptor oxidoreductase family protein [Jatrophihabitans sp.]|uniref:2-oxoacid:acceptor oxidoreductase family protein n=1 Tax=Jatrophihabitans sp. TaxID=1932789 RepID=UPI002DFA4610|nr:2-oxoacid:acceptor oxidoreductase family protein [Jatrophihabitans sp.]
MSSRATFEVRLHGRGGQGVVTAAELLSVAAFLDGRESQAFPSFGSERMGAPVMSFCRVSDRPIRVREPVLKPSAVVVADATLLHHVDVFSGLAADGFVLINSAFSPTDLGLEELVATHPAGHVITVPATDLAREHVGRPLPNVCLLGALAALTGIVSLGALEQAVRERFPAAVADGNVRAAAAAATLVPEVARA